MFSQWINFFCFILELLGSGRSLIYVDGGNAIMTAWTAGYLHILANKYCNVRGEDVGLIAVGTGKPTV